MYIRMGAGAYVGRIGGLAVALGIGAAVFVGQGVASAEPSTTSGSASSSESRSGAASSENKQQHGEKSDTTTDSSDAKAAATESTPKKTKKSSASRQSTHEPNGTTEKAGTAAARTVRAATESVKTADETRKADAPKAAEDPAPTTNVTVSSVPNIADVVVETPKQRPQPPVMVVTTAISSVVSAVRSPLAGNSPTAPLDSPLPWMMMAAARQEFGRTAGLTKPANLATTSAAAAPTPLAAAATTVTPPVAIPQTAPLEGLQYLPVIGPAFVTPVVALIHRIPVVGDVLHPFIGYPVQPGLAPGAPVPRDVEVISFDGTPIYVHFMPAVGLEEGQTAPTILDGPGLALPGGRA